MRYLALLGIAACGSEDFLVVTIEARPAVHDVASLEVSLLDETGTSRGDSFAVDNDSFPSTFSISGAPTGNLHIEILAKDAEGIVVGHGAGDTLFAAQTASLLLDSADFVINTDFADDQFPSNDFESHGYQVSSSDDGTWTAVYRERCNTPCNMLARRFDVTGRALESGLAAGTNSFPVSTELGDGLFTTPATATSGTTTIAVWNFQEPAPTSVNGIACRAMDAQGNGVGDQKNVAVETSFPFGVAVTPLPNGNFAAAWNAASTIKSAIINGTCVSSAPLAVSTTAGSSTRASVTGSGDRIMYAWILNDEVRIRLTGLGNLPFDSNDRVLVPSTATETVSFVRVAPLEGGFAVLVRWQAMDSTQPGKIELYRTNEQGQVMGNPTVVTTKSGSDFLSVEEFSVTTRSDGALLVAWHSCMTDGDGSGCGVFGRLVRSNGVPVGDEFSLATTLDLDQTAPSVTPLPGAFAAVWADLSLQPPDKAGSSVRGRIIYPAFDDATRVIGAACTGNADCNEGLACGSSSDGGKRCFATCDAEGPAPQCPGGGTCSSADAGVTACLF